ncbi:MAG: phosphomannomutase/phosphoglucomutase [bacterium]
MAGIFKAYDIRGIYPDQLDEEMAYDIGVAIGNLMDRGTIVVGHDMREVAIPISKVLIDGLRATGQDVIDIGLCSTPMNYNAIGHFDAQGGVMVTASHNPSEYIGFKLSRDEAKPVAYETGINEVEEAVKSGNLPETDNPGEYRQENFIRIYQDIILGFAEKIKPLKVAIDCGNGMGGLTVPEIYRNLPVDVEEMYFELDGSFPNHLPNPLEEENMKDLQDKVKTGDFDLGMAFDGDADRVAFVDENGEIIASDMITALLVKPMLEKNPGDAIIYDLRSSRAVPEEIEKYGGQPVRYRVGHAYMKAKMREVNGVFGGELSGHYYFRDNYFTDCGMIASLELLNLLSENNKKLSELIKPLKRYARSGDINFKVEEKEKAMQALAERFEEAETDWLDGVTVQFEDWWFNVRASNTEPYLRLNMEADTDELLEEKLALVREEIEKYVSS